MNVLPQLTVAICLVAPMVVTAQNSQPGSSLTANPVYEKNCAKCHGKTAEGRFMGGPSLISEKTLSMSPDDLRAIINKGKHHMPKFEGKLTSEEIDILVTQIKAQRE
jgi:mono/diheme cytochrome c family protein